MRKVAGLALLFCAVTYASGPSAEKEVVELERKFYSAWQEKSLQAVDSNVASDGVSWSEWGTFDKTAQMANQKAANANCTIKAFEFRDVRVTSVSRDAVLIVYAVNQDAMCGTLKAPSPVSNSSLWVRRKGRWVNVYRASVSPRIPGAN